MIRRSRSHQIAWLVLLAACAAAFLALTFKVNAVKSEVRLIERQIIAAERAKLLLETEFQTRASQHQLSLWNQVEFGYGAPRADQYVEHERELASLGTPRGLDAPTPIRVARADVAPAQDRSVFDDWLDDDTDVTHPAPIAVGMVRTGSGSAAASSLAQRLARPVTTNVAVAEIGQ